MVNKHPGISPEEAAFTLRPKEIPELEKEVRPETIIGQPRAVQALRMGTEIKGQGYNVFVTGASGTGRRTAINITLGELGQIDSVSRDIVYVFNFKQPDHPMVLYLNPGKGAFFKKELHQLVENLKSEVKLRLDGSQYKNQRDELVAVVEKEENRRLSEFEALLSKEGLQIVYVQEEEGQATDIVPMVNGQPVPFSELHKGIAAGQISEDDWNALREKYYRYMDDMKKIFSDLKVTRGSLEDELKELQIAAVKPAISVEVDRLRHVFPDEKIWLYLKGLEEDLLENLYLFMFDTPFIDEGGNPQLVRYGVNVIEDRSAAESFPVITETHPSYMNLFGNVDAQTESGGERRSNFMMIQAGSIIRASGGFLIINAEDLLQEEGSWYHLKRTLQTGRVEIQYRQSSGPWNGPVLKPQPIEVDVKVILIGTEGMYDALYLQDHEFKKYFKLHAEFSGRMERNKEGMAQYVGYIRQQTAREKLKECDSSGICAIIEHGVRLAGDREKMSTRFSKIADLIREADYWAEKAGKKTVDRDSVQQAVRENGYLSNRMESEIDEMILQGDVLVKVSGSEPGRVNGLAVYDRGYHSFGSPSVISARVAPGERGLVNIEREAGLSGEIHNKGILILEGFLRSAYAGDFPLSIHASICFEQSYNMIDGDSASSTEVYALVSSVTGIPLRQDIAVTGSINQMGQIQPVGGITDKVEGFFRICKKAGLTGTQGVIIPVQNVRNLMLAEDVREAIARDEFTVYAITHVNDGLEILTGSAAGERVQGEYPADSINGLVETRLREMAEQVRRYHHST